MSKKAAKSTGPRTLFPGKIRKPVTLTLTPRHHQKVTTNKERLGITRSDLVGLLVERYADSVERPTDEYQKLVDAIEALGGTLKYEAWHGPRGGRWLLKLSGKEFAFASKRPDALEGCYLLKNGAESGPASEINVAGLRDLLTTLSEHDKV
jgi:hypothetical protein